MHESGILHGSSEMGVLTVTERGALDESDFDFDERLMTDLVRVTQVLHSGVEAMSKRL